MTERLERGDVKLTVVIPCYNEEKTLIACVERVLELGRRGVGLEVVIVDDCSRDRSLAIAEGLAEAHAEVRVLHHERNQGKGAALRTGFRHATGDFVAVQDADLEYNPLELLKLLEPLLEGEADVVYGSRFAGGQAHRVLYFWHSQGNAFLTFLSNMFTDLNLTDMETCYKVFRREVIQSIPIEEDRFGFEPEITAKIAHRRLRVYEMGISYHGRTYEEGKKIGWRDGMRALYCIMRYNAPHLPLVMQFLVYLFIGGAAAVANFLFFLVLFYGGGGLSASAVGAFVLAAAVNYVLCVLLLFHRGARWGTVMEIAVYCAVVALGAGVDLSVTLSLHGLGAAPWLAKAGASAFGLVLNFLGRRYWVFPMKPRKEERGLLPSA